VAWKALLHGDPVPWLLERSDPAVRANTLRTLLVTLQVATILKHAFGEAAA
jgi:hypothetical protein